MSHEDSQSPGFVSRRTFLRGSALATGALSAALLPGADAEAQQLPEAGTADPRRTTVEMTVNGVAYRKEIANHTTLAQFLREDLDLTGTKIGCDRLQCGACTVLLNGRNVYACTTLAVEVSGATVQTIEGLATGDRLHPIQQAFVDHSGFQCGFCTSGQIMTAKALLERTPSPTEDQVRSAMAGNMCRCSAYKRILESVMAASRQMRA